ncbi:MAG: HEAT repeat domain-containing protein [Planctomycetota bacterium]
MNTCFKILLAVLTVISGGTGCANAEVRPAAEQKDELSSRVQMLIAACKDPDQNVQRAAINALGQTKSPQAVETLLELCDSQDEQVRQLAVTALGNIGDARCVDTLLDALRDNERYVRRAAAAALAKIADKRALPAFVNLLGDPDLGESGTVSDALIGWGDEAVDELAKALQKGPISRRAAARLLARIGTPKAVRALGAAAKDKSWRVRAEALRAMRNVKQRPVDLYASAVTDKVVMVREAAVEGLVTWAVPSDKSAVLSALIEAADDKDTRIRKLAVTELCKHVGEDNRITGVLIQCLADEDEQVRQTAAGTLWDLQSSEVLEALIKHRKDKNTAVRSYALRGIAASPDKGKAATYLGEAALDSEEQVSRLAMSTLRSMYSKASGQEAEKIRAGAGKDLVKALQHKEPYVRAEAADTLGAMQFADAAASLEEVLLEDPDPRARHSAAEALGRIAQPRSLVPLIRALNDDHAIVWSAAAEALEGKIITGASNRQTKAAVAALSKFLKSPDRDSRVRGIVAVGKIGGPEASKALAVLAEDKVPIVLLRLAEALEKIGDPQAGKLLTRLLNRSDREALAKRSALYQRPEYDYQFVAIRAVGRMKEKSAVKPLTERLRDPHYRLPAAESLGQIGDPSAVPALLALVENKDSRVRAAAVRALANIPDDRATGKLVKLTKDKSSQVRDAAIIALGAHKNEQAAECLMAIAQSDAHTPRVRFAAARALGRMHPKKAFEAYVTVLPEIDVASYENIAKALQESGKADLVEALISLLKADEQKARSFAINELPQLGDPRAIEPLKQLLRDKDDSIRSAAERALKKLESRTGG